MNNDRSIAMSTKAGGAIGPAVRNARKAKGLSLRELAAKADVSPSLLSQIENSKANPSVATLYAIAAALDVPPSHLFQDLQEAGDGATGRPTGNLHLRELPAEARRSTSQGAVVAFPPAQDAPPTRGPVVRRVERATIELLGGVTWFRLTPRDEASVEFLEIVYEVGASSGEKLSRHSGREYGVLLEGELLLELGFERFHLSAGDSIAFDSSTPHRLTNVGRVPTRAVWVVVNH